MAQFMTDRKQQLPSFAQVLWVITRNLVGSLDNLVIDVHNYPLEGKHPTVDVVPETHQELQGQEGQQQPEKLVESQIHEQLEKSHLPSHNMADYKEDPNMNEIQEIIQICGSNVYQSPTKTSKSVNRSFLRDLSPKSKHQKLLAMEVQKARMEQNLKRLEADMKQIKQQEHSANKVTRKATDISNDVEAAEKSQRMLLRIQKQRKQMQQKKNQQQIKLLEMLEKDALEKEEKRKVEIQKIKEQKRVLILKKMEDKKRQREQKMMINRQSNALINELRKSQSGANDKSSITISDRKKTLRPVRDVSARDNTDQDKVVSVDQQKHHKIRVRSKVSRMQMEDGDQPRSVVHYPKGKFLNIIQEEERKKKEEERYKQQAKRIALQKRIKYGQLVKNLFVPSNSKSQSRLKELRVKPPTPDAPASQVRRQPLPRRTQQQVYNNRADSKQKHAGQEPSERGSSLSGKESNQNRFQKDQQREKRLKQHRKLTQLRLKKATEKQRDLQQKKLNLPSIRKYSNYLKDLPKGKPVQNDWKKILGNQKLSKQEKYAQLMSKASVMENKAKINEQFSKADDQTMDLIIGSIQAKLALLDGL